MDYPFAERLGELAREHDVALSVHAPLFGFMGHLEASGRKFIVRGRRARPERGIAAASGAELVVFHPGFLLERSREDAIDAVVEQLGDAPRAAREKDRAVPFGVEVMGRVRDLGSLDDVLEISRRTAGCGPCSTSRTCMRPATERSSRSSRSRPHWLRSTRSSRRAPFHIHFSDIAFANRNETKHLPYGEGRCGRSRSAMLSGFERPATVISESPDEASSQAIRSVLAAAGTARRVAPETERRPRAPEHAGSPRAARAARPRRTSKWPSRASASAERKSSSASSSRPWAARTAASAVAASGSTCLLRARVRLECEALGLVDLAEIGEGLASTA